MLGVVFFIGGSVVRSQSQFLFLEMAESAFPAGAEPLDDFLHLGRELLRVVARKRRERLPIVRQV